MSGIRQSLFAFFSRLASSTLGRLFHRAVVTLSAMLFFCPVILRTGSSPAVKLPRYTYTGVSTLLDDENGNWRIKFLTSGTLEFEKDAFLDVFVAGGGGGGYGIANDGGGGGGGGYTNKSAYQIIADTPFDIIIGAGGGANADGGTSSAFGCSAIGGKKGTSTAGGAGGSGGGGGSGQSGYSYSGGNGGSNGSSGSNGTRGGSYLGGAGQGTTTAEFHEPTATLYGAGGGGAQVYGASGTGGTGGATGGGNGRGSNYTVATVGVPNSGGGGGGTVAASDLGGGGKAGGSGIVIIRNQRAS